MEQRWGLPLIAWPSRLRPNAWDLVALPLVLGLLALIAWGGMAMGARYHIGEALPMSLDPWRLPEYALRTVLRMGVALIVAEFGVIGWGGYPRVMGQPSWLSGATSVFGIVFYPTYRLFIMAAAVVVGLCLWVLLEKTRLGGLVRACVDDEEMARGMGVNVSRLYAGVFAFSWTFWYSAS